MMNVFYQYTVWPFISSILVIWFGGMVLLKNKESAANKSLFRAILTIFVWLFGTAVMLTKNDPSWQILFDKIVYAGAVWIPVSIYHFGLAVAHKKNNWLLWIGYALSAFFMAMSFTDLFIGGVYYYAWGVHRQAAIFHDLFLVYFAVYILLFFFDIYGYRKNTTGLEKVQANYILISFFVLALSSTAFLPAYGIDISPFQYLFAVLCVLILTLAVTKYHLFETKVILTETLVGIMGIILVVLPFLMPTGNLKILTWLVFILFCFFGYYLIKATHEESRRREEAEMMAVMERELRKNAEEINEDLKHLDNAKTQFLLSTQHHLRSPLSIIQGYLCLINEGSYGKIPAKAKEKIAASLEATQKLIQLINDLLDVAHFQMDKGEVAKEPTDLVKLISEIISDLKQTAVAKNIYLRFQGPAAPVARISVNSRGVREAIYNIVDNAIKYTQTGGVTVSLGSVPGKLVISVADTGIGMNEKDRQNLFNRIFERGEKAKNVNINGKGIGLYLAAQMIKGSGGTVHAKSAGWGKGTEFIIELPKNAPNPSPS